MLSSRAVCLAVGKIVKVGEVKLIMPLNVKISDRIHTKTQRKGVLMEILMLIIQPMTE